MRSEKRGIKHQKLDTVKLFIGLLFVGFFLTFSSSIYAAPVDYSDTKDFFKSIRVGENLEDDLSDNSLSNPFADSGNVKGYKFELDKSVDIKKLDLRVQSCAVKISFLCAGDSFDEVVYVLDSKFQPVVGEFKQKEVIDFSKFTFPENGTLYLLIGSEKASKTGQYIVSSSLK